MNQKSTRDEILADAFELIYSELSDVGKETVDAVLDRIVQEKRRSQKRREMADKQRDDRRGYDSELSLELR